MTFEIPQDQFDRLAVRAHAAGYSSVEAMISALAGEPVDDPRGSLTEDQLRKSIAECERGVAEIRAGCGRDFREAMIEIGRERRFLGAE